MRKKMAPKKLLAGILAAALAFSGSQVLTFAGESQTQNQSEDQSEDQSLAFESDAEEIGLNESYTMMRWKEKPHWEWKLSVQRDATADLGFKSRKTAYHLCVYDENMQSIVDETTGKLKKTLQLKKGTYKIVADIVDTSLITGEYMDLEFSPHLTLKQKFENTEEILANAREVSLNENNEVTVSGSAAYYHDSKTDYVKIAIPERCFGGVVYNYYGAEPAEIRMYDSNGKEITDYAYREFEKGEYYFRIQFKGRTYGGSKAPGQYSFGFFIALESMKEYAPILEEGKAEKLEFCSPYTIKKIRTFCRKIEWKKDGVASFKLRALGGGASGKICLYDANDQLLARKAGKKVSLKKELKAGTYYIKITQTGNRMDFLLCLERITDTNQTDTDKQQKAVQTIQEEKVYTENYGYKTKGFDKENGAAVCTRKFEWKEDGKAVFNLRTRHSGTANEAEGYRQAPNVRVCLFDADGNKIAAATGKDCSIQKDLKAGTYYVKVKPNQKADHTRISFELKRDTSVTTVDGFQNIEKLLTPLKLNASSRLSKKEAYREYSLNLKKDTKITFDLATINAKTGKSVAKVGSYRFRIFDAKSKLLTEQKGDQVKKTITLKKGNYQISIWGGQKVNKNKKVYSQLSIREVKTNK